MSKFPYCEKCLKQPTTETQAGSAFYDFRFDYPVCLDCVREQNLDPNQDSWS
jgi:hypothetical protein